MEKSFRGNQNWVVLAVGESRLHFSFPAAQALPATGESLSLCLPPAAIHAMLPEPDQPAAMVGAHA